ncbi:MULTISPECIES: DUF2971 domain-containing protein [Pseudomonas]|uniref:DUF2971 domain-containing protein n=1 Tax=Pseudomonas TaxID=286 RepID=UPI002362099E|nr:MULTISPECIES: DUF2971 domain-containing protein [Pseudomonas]WJV22257.1 DUF2971 domain-containing protein [Pseudomonas chlororaphis]
MIGYKYRAINKYSLDALERNSVYFSKYTDFNDPFEFSTPFPDLYKMYTRAADGVDRLYEEGKLTQADHQHLKQVCQSIVLDGNNGKDEIHKKIREKMTNTGVYSMSEVNDEILMWSHYADNHRGFCIGFDDLHKSMEIAPKVMPVNYINEYTDLSDPQIVLDFYSKMFYKYKNLPERKWLKKYETLKKIYTRYDDEKMAVAVLTDKYIKWGYEKEFRLICEHSTGLKRHTPKCIKTITFGLRTSNEDKERIMKICQNSLKSHVKFYRTDTVPGLFKLKIKALAT